jgi:hypothetical protein
MALFFMVPRHMRIVTSTPFYTTSGGPNRRGRIKDDIIYVAVEEGCAMASRASSEIDYSAFPASDGEPMAETFANAIQMVDLQWTLQTLFDQQGRAGTTTVGGNQFVYYNPANGRDNISPDVYVTFDRPPPGPPKWQTWVEGKFPDIVFEITSPSTHREDVGRKRSLYPRLGAQEYYIYDPQQETTPSFQGFERRGGQMEPLPLLPGGGIMSPLLRAELWPVARGETRRRPAGTWLRVIDPATTEPIPITDEEHESYRAAVEQLTATEEQLTMAQARLAEQERARVEAEAELRALRALLGDRERPLDSGPAPE